MGHRLVTSPIASFYQTLIDWCLPQALKDNPVTHKNAGMIVGYTISSCLLALLYAPYYWFIDQPFGVNILLFTVGFGIQTLWIIRVTSSPSFAGNYITAIFFITIFYLIYNTGGLDSPNNALLVAIIPMAFLLCGRVFGLCWLFVATTSIMILYSLKINDYPLPVVTFTPGQWEAYVIIAISAGFFATTLLLYVMETMKHGAFFALDKVIQELEHEKKAYEKVSNQLSGALAELQTVNEELKLANTKDGLTNVKNRRFFEEKYHSEYKRCQREVQPLSILMIDIDYFKKLNDNYGHAVGDECLIAVAQTIKSVVKRPSDAVARYGGEEFSVILANTPLEGAAHVAEKIRSAVEALSFQFKDEVIRTSISVGVACEVPEGFEVSRAILESADACLYRAKAEGRNRVCSDNPNTETNQQASRK